MQFGSPVWIRFELFRASRACCRRLSMAGTQSGHVSNSPRKPKIASGCAVIQNLTTGDDVRHANGRLVIFAVHSQTSAINFGSRERGLDLAGLDLTKYSPETCATPGEVARYRDTAAPCFEFSMNGFTTARIRSMSGGI